MGEPTRKLFFGDNLEIMREHVSDESVNLVYLDPPFNSKQTYNVLFKTDDARPSQAQMEAGGRKSSPLRGRDLAGAPRRRLGDQGEGAAETGGGAAGRRR